VNAAARLIMPVSAHRLGAEHAPALFEDRLALLAQLKGRKRALVHQYARSSNVRGWVAVTNTLLPLVGLWVIMSEFASHWEAVALLVVPMSLLLLRSFALLHDCGHGSLFHSKQLNRIFGFVFGVISGMPQYVWSQHHHYHHTTNGNWSRYRGPLAILSVAEFDALTPRQQRRYIQSRHLALAPLAGLLYLVVQPRVNWLRGLGGLAAHVWREKTLHADVSIRQIVAQFRTRYWKTPAEFRHMTLNNIVLLALWALMSLWSGPAFFFSVYLISASLAGAAGLVLFTVQHNFEHSYAGDDHEWDYDEAALYGSSFLVLPGWLNWCTAHIGYHHIHHLSARIPSYRLVDCHEENAALFAAVPRLTLRDVPPSLKYLLWDESERRLLTVVDHRAMRAAAMCR
jgi:acyl-lipid omega-6 desaturase (Delta-12 desaturase)